MSRRNGLPPASPALAPFTLALMLLSTGQFGHSAQGQAPVQLELERTIPLPNVSEPVREHIDLSESFVILREAA